MDELMTQEAFEKWLADFQEVGPKNGYCENEYGSADDPTFELECEDTLKSAYAAALARIEALGAERRWIPVEEQLPHQGVKVLINYNTPCVEDEPDVAVYVGIDLWCVGPEEYLDRVYSKITHWMPLPPAPE